MEHSRYHSNGARGWSTEIVTARNLAENKIYDILYPSIEKWWNDPESKRKRRVAKYKLYSAEGKIKSSFKKGYCWIGRKCIMMVRRL
ncbi:hypothetical protein CFP56_006641 [Quercus suber]|uniref:Uncharacterized protein n=1 Tax=Quercus suber TaxID=58331 RepID=A0AAW0L7M3_QUESU